MNRLFTDASLTFAYSPWFYLLAAMLAVALAYGVYRYTLPPVGRWKKAVLWGLRAIALALLILLLFEPLLSYIEVRQRDPVVAVLVDQSASMAVEANGNNRAAELKTVLESKALRSLNERLDVRYFAFSDSAAALPFDSLDKLALTGVGTNPAGAWMRAQAALAGENLRTMIVISDGAYNMGENPARAAAASAIPIHTVGIGDTAQHADAVITEILTNDVTYVGSKVPVDVRLRARGLSDKPSVLHLYGRNGVLLERRAVTFRGDDAEVTVAMSFDAGEAGDVRIIARLDSVPGETLLDNNRRSVIVRVLEKKARIVLFGGNPGADLTALRQTLEADTSVEVLPFIQIGRGALLQKRALPTDEELRGAKLIVLVDFPTRDTPPALTERIAAAIRDQRIPLLLLAGPQLAAAQLAPLQEVLPVRVNKAALSEESVTARPATAHAALTGREPLPVEWSDLPPLYGGAGNFSVDPLAVTAVKFSRTMLGIEEQEPGLALWEAGGRRGAAFLFWGTARWRLQMAGNPGAAGFYKDLLERIRAWLEAPVEERLLRIRTSKRLYSGGEPVRFTAQVYAPDLTPRDDVMLTLHVTAAGRREAVPLQNRGSGRFEGQMNPWAEGEFRFSGSAVSGADTLGSDDGLFAVEAFNLELIDPRARHDALRQIAERSRGVFVTATTADSLFDALNDVPQRVAARRELPLWNRAALTWIIIGLLGMEWLIRKRSGML